jgi:hypothetical protein
VLLEDADATLDRLDASQCRRPDASLHVSVEELRHARRRLVCRRLGLHARPPRVASGFDFADEEALPVAGFLHRLNRPLPAGFHTRYRELVDRELFDPYLLTLFVPRSACGRRWPASCVIDPRESTLEAAMRRAGPGVVLALATIGYEPPDPANTGEARARIDARCVREHGDGSEDSS